MVDSGNTLIIKFTVNALIKEGCGNKWKRIEEIYDLHLFVIRPEVQTRVTIRNLC